VAATPPAPPEPLPPLPPALAVPELASYEIRYGLFGEVGRLSLLLRTPSEKAPRTLQVTAVGAGEGAILGLGHMRKTVETAFDVTRLSPASWITSRWRDGEQVEDRGHMQPDGVWALERRRTGKQAELQQARFALPILDPVALVLRLRVAPPAIGRRESLLLMDGRQLWRLTIEAQGRGAPSDDLPAAALRFACRAEPVFWDGRPDGERPTRAFTLWLADDGTRLPLRLEMPLALGTVVVTLKDLRRGTAAVANSDAGSDVSLVQALGAAPPEPAGARNL
jgi:hypothetical protein